MKKLLIAMTAVVLLAGAPQRTHAQYGPFSVSEDAISPPLLGSSGQSAAPVPSAEIAPGAADLLTPTNHVSPYDPLGSSLESTDLSPYIYDQSNALAPGAINTLVPDAVYTAHAGESAALAGPAAHGAGISSWETRPTARHPLAVSTAPPPMQVERSSAGTGGASAPVTSTWGTTATAQAQPSSSSWTAGRVAPPEPPEVAELRAISQGAQASTGSSPRGENAGIRRGPASNSVHRPGASMTSSASITGGQPGKMGGFQDSTTGSAYLPQASPAVRTSSLTSNLAAESANASPFRDLSATRFLSPTLTPTLLSGNSFGSHTLERERGGLNGAQNRLHTRNGNSLERSELPTARRARQRGHRYRNPILEQMEEQSSANR